MKEFLDVSIGDKIPLAGSKQQVKGLVLEAKDNNSKHHHHGNDTEYHSAKHLKVSAER